MTLKHTTENAPVKVQQVHSKVKMSHIPQLHGLVTTSPTINRYYPRCTSRGHTHMGSPLLMYSQSISSDRSICFISSMARIKCRKHQFLRLLRPSSLLVWFLRLLSSSSPPSSVSRSLWRCDYVPPWAPVIWLIPVCVYLCVFGDWSVMWASRRWVLCAAIHRRLQMNASIHNYSLSISCSPRHSLLLSSLRLCKKKKKQLKKDKTCAWT